MRTLVTGATGPVGSRLAHDLVAGGGVVRVLTRDEERAAPFWDAGFDVVLGDLADAGAAKRAVADMDAVVHLAPADPEATIRLARAALNAGVETFVYVTGRIPGAEHELRRMYREEGLGLRMVRLVQHTDFARGLLRALGV
jgi:uncharacterized protein YbjT (DUF2867 family)